MSRYDRFRKRLAPIALVLAIGLLVRDSCRSQRTHTTVELTFGADRAAVRAVEIAVESSADDDFIATFRCAARPGTLIDGCRFPMVVPGEDGQFLITVDLGDSLRRLTRAFHAVEGATMKVAIPDASAP